MTLSQRAQAILARGRRVPCPTEPREVAALLTQAQLPVFDRVIAFQEQFGGVEYHVGRSQDSFLLGIVRSWDDDVFGFEEEGRYYFECAEHSSAQLRFFMDDLGTFYVDDFPLASSVERYIESDALIDEMTWQGHWHHVDAGQVARDDRRVDALVPLPVMPEVSDEFIQWWGMDSVRVCRDGLWAPKDRLDRILIYARSRRDARHIRGLFRGLTGHYI